MEGIKLKRTYEKPLFAVECFTMAQSVAAAGCGAVAGGNTLGGPNQWTKTDCGWNMGNQVVWTEANSGCSVKLGENDPFDAVCYNNPGGGNSIFSS